MAVWIPHGSGDRGRRCARERDRLAPRARRPPRAAVAARLGALCLVLAGVPAAAVQNAEDTNEHDPQIAHRGLFFELDHPVIGEARFEGTPIKFSKTVQENWRSAPLLGEDTEYVCRDLLGMDEEEYQENLAAGAFS